MLNSAEHEISKLDESNLINVLEKLLTCKDFQLCLSNQSFKFNLLYILKDKLSFKVWAQIQLSTDSSFINTGPGYICFLLFKLAYFTFNKRKPFENIVGKEENAGNQHFLLFLQCFLLFRTEIAIFGLHLFCCLQMLSIWTGLKFCRLVKGKVGLFNSLNWLVDRYIIQVFTIQNYNDPCRLDLRKHFGIRRRCW